MASLLPNGTGIDLKAIAAAAAKAASMAPAATPAQYPAGPQNAYLSQLNNMAAQGQASLASQSIQNGQPIEEVPFPDFNPASFMDQVLSEAEAQSQATSMYKPQLDYLSGLEGTSKANASESQAKLGSLYDSVANQISGMSTGIGQSYDSSIGNVGSAYQEALQNVLGRYSQSDSEMNATLERLGITAAQPNTQGKSFDQRNFLTGLMDSNQMTAKNALTRQKQGALDFNTKQTNITRQTGANAQAGVTKQLQQFLQELGLKRAGIQGDIMKSAMDLRSGSQKSAQESMRDAYDRYKDKRSFRNQDRSFEYSKAKDTADLELQTKKMLADAKPAKDPLGDVQTMASRLYGGNPTAAQNAIDAIQSTMTMGAGDYGTPKALTDAVISRLSRNGKKVNDAAQLRSLVDAMFKSGVYGAYRTDWN